MKKGVIVLIVVIALVLLISGTVFALSRTQKETFIVNMDIEGVNSFPPRLTILREREIVQETALLSIFSGINTQALSITPSATTMEGTVTLICQDFEETKTFKLQSNTLGEGMEQRITFKGVPEDSDCLANAVTVSCDTDQARCSGGNLFLRLETPELN